MTFLRRTLGNRFLPVAGGGTRFALSGCGEAAGHFTLLGLHHEAAYRSIAISATVYVGLLYRAETRPICAGPGIRSDARRSSPRLGTSPYTKVTVGSDASGYRSFGR